MNDTPFIDDEAGLRQAVSELSAHPWVAIDTEFQREKTYYAKLCLIQLATPNQTAIIDPLAIKDLSPLLDWLYREEVTKVFHAARQDQELFFDRTGKPLPNVFDTQLAAPLLGYPEQAGYARLVQDVLGIQLKKTHSRTDWTRRPLSDAQLAYAADDVIYLAQLFPLMHEQLAQKNRLDWLNKEFSKLADPELYRMDPESAWQRIRYSKQMKGESLAIVQKLAQWRELQAQAQDLPRGWLLKDEVIIDLAKQKPGNDDALGLIRGLNPSQRKKHGQTLLQLIQTGRDTPASDIQSSKRSKPATAEDEALIDYLMSLIRLRCQQSEMNPASVTSRSELLKLIRGERNLPLLSGWQRDLVGAALLDALAGKTRLRIEGGKLVIQTPD